MPRYTINFKRCYEQDITVSVEGDDLDQALEKAEDEGDFIDHPNLDFDQDVPIWAQSDTGERTDF